MTQTSQPVVRIKKLKTLLAVVENAVRGDNYTFRNIFADVGGEETDILEDGRLSCSIFASWILLGLGLLKRSHATVSGTQRDLLESGWVEISAPRPGAVLVWEKQIVDGGEHRHIGFCVSETEAISNSSADQFPRKHPIEYNGRRRIEAIYWHPDFDQG
ncbi:MAG TPA: hypothetical protein VG866_00380 [Candidatus Paceibacterota bacterium]|nr:hypothetical protein [Candidatus Paceibacterota bacterium]